MAVEMPSAALLVPTGSIRTYQEAEESADNDTDNQMILEIEENLDHRGVNILIKV